MPVLLVDSELRLGLLHMQVGLVDVEGTMLLWSSGCSGGASYRYDYDYDYNMAPQRGRPYGANLGSMGRNTGTWSIRSECLSNITSWSRRKGIENTTLPFIPYD